MDDFWADIAARDRALKESELDAAFRPHTENFERVVPRRLFDETVETEIVPGLTKLRDAVSCRWSGTIGHLHAGSRELGLYGVIGGGSVTGFSLDLSRVGYLTHGGAIDARFAVLHHDSNWAAYVAYWLPESEPTFSRLKRCRDEHGKSRFLDLEGQLRSFADAIVEAMPLNPPIVASLAG